MKSALQITPAEFQILEVLWRCSEAQTVGQVLEALRRQRDLAYTTVMTLLDKLARKGSVFRHREGKAYLYRPAVQRREVLECLIQEFTDNYCGGERAQLVRAVRGSLVDGKSRPPEPLAKPSKRSPPSPPTTPDPDLDVVLL